ncbi:MAG TPA: SRPBCC family protein [Ramlibacter sp.]|uniref:SRPBCC family protein n=1 Tax=Ramlibacter sp. TaxID=1917967 RepID=UPI002D7E71D6|nr:SRPBCC family protein [Ramlibacter sp.]HET8746949.1 SRPBCC family protein [Ramlibacter sp.]
MKVQLDKSFALGAPAAAAWLLLQDLEAVAACMPGARITEKVDARHVKGTVTVKLGPASLVFRGEVQVKDVDEEGRSLFLIGRGTDATGTSGAAMDLRAHIEEAGTTACRLVGAAEVSVSGKAATFGGRMMSAVADQVLQQFAANFAEKLRGIVPPPEPSAARPAEAAAEPVPAATAPTPPPARQELNGLALLWAVLRNWLHQLFPARRA